MLQRLGLLLAGTLVALLLAELVLAFFAPQVTRSPYVWDFDADTGWANRPNARGRLVSPEFDVEFAINAEGLRGPEIEPAKRAGTRRVAIFGDSFAEGWGVDEPATLRADLEARLRARGSAPVEVLNFGVAGFGDDQSLLTFRKVWRRFAPDVAVLVVYGNDFWDNTMDSGNGGWGRMVPKPHFALVSGDQLLLQGAPAPRTGAWDPPAFPSVAWFTRTAAELAGRSHVATLVLRAWKGANAPPQPFYYERIYEPDHDRETIRAWALTEKLIAAFAAEARASGVRFVLLYASDAIEVDDASRARVRAASGFGDGVDFGAPSRELARIAAAHDVAFVDLRAVLRANASGGPFYFREGHWNAAGTAAAADALAEVIAP